MVDVIGRTGDFVLAPNQYVFIQDRTKGQVSVYVGPHKSTLSDTDIPIIYDRRQCKFVQTGLNEAIQQFTAADEGSYVILENPSAEEGKQHPGLGNSSPLVRLNAGRKINIPGPETFALWPGQVASAIPGHQLRTNQYLVARVYNDEAALANWKSAVMKPAEATPTGEGTPPNPPTVVEPPKFTMGQLVIIKGTEYSFFIPPTGLEVVPEDNGQYVREAVTLERLEYCILLAEDGNKRYMRGPAVVFPESNEQFITTPDGRSRKFRAIELNPDMGLYIKVTADYSENGTTHKAGDELFITGKEQRLYFPRAEHALVKYGDREIQFGVAIPEGEARYMLDKETGRVNLVKGPCICLPDPRTQVIVRRVLSESEVTLLYPGNTQAVQYNANLRALASAKGGGAAPLSDGDVRDQLGRATTRGTRQAVADYQAEAFAGDSITRSTSHTPPRTITLDTKFEGAVAVNVWKGYAVLVLDKSGNQRVEVGPKTVLLAYDETLQAMELSTGKPKNTDRLHRTGYLKCFFNQVSDIVEVVTKDMVTVQLKLAYRVNFEGNDPSNWFNVENYVKFLCDDGRSRLRSAAKRYTIEQFNHEYIEIVRDTILGAKAEGGDRPDRSFGENDLHIYDVELAGITIGDGQISTLLTDQQHSAVTAALQLATQEQKLKDTERLEGINRQISEQKAKTADHQRELLIKELEGRQATQAEELKVQAAGDAAKDAAQVATLARLRATEEQQLAKLTAEQKLRLELLDAEVQAVVDKTKAIGPGLIEAMSAFSEKDSATRLAQSLSPLAILGGTNVKDVVSNILGGTSIGEAAKTALASVIRTGPGNGDVESPRVSR